MASATCHATVEPRTDITQPHVQNKQYFYCCVMHMSTYVFALNSLEAEELRRLQKSNRRAFYLYTSTFSVVRE